MFAGINNKVNGWQMMGVRLLVLEGDFRDEGGQGALMIYVVMI